MMITWLRLGMSRWSQVPCEADRRQVKTLWRLVAGFVISLCVAMNPILQTNNHECDELQFNATRTWYIWFALRRVQYVGHEPLQKTKYFFGNSCWTCTLLLKVISVISFLKEFYVPVAYVLTNFTVLSVSIVQARWSLSSTRQKMSSVI